ncbi:myc protein-like [Daphnia carinata]|uniref:myc protein-like n=1 Tax=Daphnia carinata TaxID=120202 RepID=UPI00257EFA91|nr:myc protein-like [Daphnia carinata]
MSSMCESLFFGHSDLLLSSTGPCIMTTNDCSWSSQLDMPTPPVSPSRSNDNDMKKETTSVIDEDLDLGLGELISGMDLPLFLDNLDSDAWFSDLHSDAIVPDVLPENKCDSVNELRHDCMWAGHCPAEEHRSKKDLVQLPCLLSSSPPESTVLTMPCVLPIAVGCRTRLDTLGSVRPETPISLSDSELDADQLTSDEGSNKIHHSSSSSSGDESESDEDPPMMNYQPTLPPNIHPVRSHQMRKMTNNNKLVKTVSSSNSSLIPDHSYSHSDHSYHTQRRPVMSDHLAMAFELGAPTPSDSEEEIDVVSLGEVLRMNPSAAAAAMTATTGKSLSAGNVASPTNTTSVSHAPLRLKLKVGGTPAASGQVLMRKALPSHPSALVRQQLQLAVASAAQQRKHSEQTSKKSGDIKLSGKMSHSERSSSSNSERSSSKRPRSSGESGSSSPRKRCSRAASDSEDSCEKRSQHNSMERQRRVDLRNAFEFLRSLIPDLEATDRAAKVVILKKAANFCQGLTNREKQFVADKDALQKRQEMLRKRLALLQRRR